MKLFGISQCIHPSTVAQIKKLNNSKNQMNSYDPYQSFLVSQEDIDSDNQRLTQQWQYQLQQQSNQKLDIKLEQQIDQEQLIQSKQQSTPENWFQTDSCLQPNTEHSEWCSVSPYENEAIQAMSTPGFTGFSCDTSQNIYDTRSPFNILDATPTTTTTTITPRCQQGFSQKGLKLDADDDCLTVSAEQNYQEQLPAFGAKDTPQNKGITANTGGEFSRQRMIGQLRKGSFCMLKDDTAETNQGANQNAIKKGAGEKQEQKDDQSKQMALIRQKLCKIQRTLKAVMGQDTTASEQGYPKQQNLQSRITSSQAQLEDFISQMKKIMSAAKIFQSLPIISSSLNALQFQFLHRLFQKCQSQYSKQSSQSFIDKLKQLSLKTQKTYNLAFQDLSGSLDQSCKNYTSSVSNIGQYQKGTQQLFEIAKELSLPRDLNQLFIATSGIISQLSILQSCGALPSHKNQSYNKLLIDKVNKQESLEYRTYLNADNKSQQQQFLNNPSNLTKDHLSTSIVSHSDSKSNQISMLNFK